MKIGSGISGPSRLDISVVSDKFSYVTQVLMEVVPAEEHAVD
jgi:hypothetical protein